MYPAAQYSTVPSDPEAVNIPTTKSTWNQRQWLPYRRLQRQPRLTIGLILILLILLFASFKRRRTSSLDPLSSLEPPKVLFRENTILFDRERRPSWLDFNPTHKPLVLRVAVVSRVEEFDRREALREGIFRGISEADARLEYRFFVGAIPDASESVRTQRLLQEEIEKFGDVIVLQDVPDIINRLSEKRYGALKWAGSVLGDTYDYFINLDSDTFCRFPALSRRLPHFFAEKNLDLNPRKDPILIARMGAVPTYFINTVPDGTPDIVEDQKFYGPWYSYPSGIGYMLSSSLVTSLVSANPPLPHHIPYPSDDVMVGAWIAALRFFPDETSYFHTIVGPNETSQPVHPKPFLPYIVNTTVIDDVSGWHDYPHEGQTRWRDELEAPISWSSVCIHHLLTDQIIAFRNREEIRGEWVSTP